LKTTDIELASLFMPIKAAYLVNMKMDERAMIGNTPY